VVLQEGTKFTSPVTLLREKGEKGNLENEFSKTFTSLANRNTAFDHKQNQYQYMEVSSNRGTPKSSILVGISIVNHPLWDIPISGNPHFLRDFFRVFARQDLMTCQTDPGP
jgi:hypothetical protein